MNPPLTSDEVFDLIEQIAATPGKNDKVALLAAAATSNLLRNVLVAAIDPLTTYGIAKLPVREERGGICTFGASTWNMIDAMRIRQLTGSAMLEQLQSEMNMLSAKSAELLGRILTKDLKAGFGDNTVNKSITGLIREYPYMRCSLPKGDKLDKIDWEKGVISQEKADAMFINLDHIAGGTVRMFSRSGTMFPTEPFGTLIDTIRAVVPEDHQMHGELMVYKAGKLMNREDGNGVLNSIAQGGSFDVDEVPFIMVWDLVPLEFVKPKGKYTTGYLARLKMIIQRFDGGKKHMSIIPTRIVKSHAEAKAHCRELMKLGKEGTIIKLPGAIWKDGTSTEQFKLKLEADVDLAMKALNPGEGKNAKTFGSIRCESSCGRLVVNVSGFKDKQRQDILDDWDTLMDGIMTVRANAIMEPGESSEFYSLFLPRSVEVGRIDKTVADSLERIKEQFEAAVDAV